MTRKEYLRIALRRVILVLMAVALVEVLLELRPAESRAAYLPDGSGEAGSSSVQVSQAAVLLL